MHFLVRKLLQNLDLFGRRPQFNIKGDERSFIVLGLCLSLMVLGIFSWAILYLGGDLIFHRNPSLIQSTVSEGKQGAFKFSEEVQVALGMNDIRESNKFYINESIFLIESGDSQRRSKSLNPTLELEYLQIVTNDDIALQEYINNAN